MHSFDPLCVSKWFTGCKPGNTQRDTSLLSRNDQMEWFRRLYGIISGGVVTAGIRATECTRVVIIILITWFTIKLAQIVWFLKIRWIVKEWSRSRGPRGNFLGSLRWHKNLWFILLTSSTLLYVRLTLLHNQTRWATCFIRALFRITGIARVDGVIPSMDPIFASR
jgi:hypothetical protein